MTVLHRGDANQQGHFGFGQSMIQGFDGLHMLKAAET
jgi:hypothetical protein